MDKENRRKKFLRYLMKVKHNMETENDLDAKFYIKELNLKDFPNGYSSEMSEDELSSWLEKLSEFFPIDSEKTKDLIFGLLYASPVFIKQSKKKEFQFKEILNLIRDRNMINRKYLAIFNSPKDCGEKNSKTTTTRFPPEPSGYLHIGHAKAAILNQTMSKNGNLIVRMDDTNPANESKEYEDCILEDLRLLKITDYRLTHSSDYFGVIYEYAVFLIKKGKAYADNTSIDVMRDERTSGKPSKNRDISPEETLRIFNSMINGHPEANGYCLRAKINVEDTNKSMCDPVIYRTSNVVHPRCGNKYKAYPTYDFTVPIVDSLEGVTLSLRSIEYRDRNKQYYWFINELELQNIPEIYDFSRFCLENTVISKRKMKFYVENEYVSGWDDPRLCTLRGLKRRGLHMDVLIEYIKMQGSSQKNAVCSWDKIWAMNKKFIDQKSPRYTGVPLKDHVLVQIIENEENVLPNILKIPRHKKNPSLGEKEVLMSRNIILSQDDAKLLEKNEEFTLMSIGNCVVTEKEENNAGVTISMVIKLNLKGDYKITKNKISFVPAEGAILYNCFEYSNLQNDKRTEDLAELFNKNSVSSEYWILESSAVDIKKGDFIQIERIGFYYCDDKFKLNLVPHTRQKRT